MGNGDGTFRQHVDYPDPGAGGVAAVGDFNQDGKLDLLVDNANTADILLGNGDGTLQAPLSFPTGGRPWGGVAADFSGDGRLDIAVGNFNDGTVSVLLQQPVAVSPLRSRVQ